MKCICFKGICSPLTWTNTHTGTDLHTCIHICVHAYAGMCKHTCRHMHAHTGPDSSVVGSPLIVKAQFGSEKRRPDLDTASEGKSKEEDLGSRDTHHESRTPAGDAPGSRRLLEKEQKAGYREVDVPKSHASAAFWPLPNQMSSLTLWFTQWPYWTLACPSILHIPLPDRPLFWPRNPSAGHICPLQAAWFVCVWWLIHHPVTRHFFSVLYWTPSACL